MINGTPITIIGNVGEDISLRYTPNGNAVASFSVAVPQRRYDRQTGKSEDKGTTWYRVIAWRGLAENVAESIRRGTRVIVFGIIESRAWENGEKSGVSWEITADAVGPDLSFATAGIRRISRDTVPDPDDPWADAPGSQMNAPAGTGHAEPDSPAASEAQSATAASEAQSATAGRVSQPPVTARGRASRAGTGKPVSA
jgi:single-strand DNA-binding protein